MTLSLPDAWPNAEHSKSTRIGTIDWHYQEIGNGPSVLFLHGAGASTHSWAPLIGLLKDRLHCLAIDLPGHGFTEGALGFQLGLAGASTEIARLLEKLDVHPDLIVGHSAGAAIAVTLATRLGEIPVVAINGAFESFEGWAGVVFPMLAKSMVALPFVRDFITVPMAQAADIEKLLETTGSPLNAEEIAYYRILLKRREHITGTLGMMSQWHLERDMPAPAHIKTFVYFVQAHDDGTVSISATEKFRRSLSNSEETVFKDGGHLIHEVYPERIADIIDHLQIIDRPLEGTA